MVESTQWKYHKQTPKLKEPPIYLQIYWFPYSLLYIKLHAPKTEPFLHFTLTLSWNFRDEPHVLEMEWIGIDKYTKFFSTLRFFRVANQYRRLHCFDNPSMSCLCWFISFFMAISAKGRNAHNIFICINFYCKKGQPGVEEYVSAYCYRKVYNNEWNKPNLQVAWSTFP